MKLVISQGGKGHPDPAEDSKQPQTHAGQQPAPTGHLQGWKQHTSLTFCVSLQQFVKPQSSYFQR